ncbi:MAG: hypothetical protein KatS3mg115_0751 [Candidatus Poribacteria bacterium]|nr:MAG: hypothetical protein KatS3mg115_0751 [Candidatus Poribacteria bacterium]
MFRTSLLLLTLWGGGEAVADPVLRTFGAYGLPTGWYGETVETEFGSLVRSGPGYGINVLVAAQPRERLQVGALASYHRFLTENPFDYRDYDSLINFLITIEGTVKSDDRFLYLGPFVGVNVIPGLSSGLWLWGSLGAAQFREETEIEMTATGTGVTSLLGYRFPTTVSFDDRERSAFASDWRLAFRGGVTLDLWITSGISLHPTVAYFVFPKGEDLKERLTFWETSLGLGFRFVPAR